MNTKPNIILAGVLVIVALGLFRVGTGLRDVSDPPAGEGSAETQESGLATTTVSLGGVSVIADIADTTEARAQGLSGRAGLAPDEGLLFVFDEPGEYGFWMKDMLFSIDILWILDGEVIHIEKNISPDTFPRVFYPDAPADRVLEVPAGFADAHEVRVGSPVTLMR